jgi:hypothetical protein
MSTVRSATGISERLAGDKVDETDIMSEASFRCSLAVVLRRYAPAMQALADYDQGKVVPHLIG